MTFMEQIKQAGVIGAGGAGFPTHAKVSGHAEYLLMNAAECEPLLRVDQQLLVLYTDEILQGFAAAAKAIQAVHAIIGIKAKHHDVIDVLQERIRALQLPIEIHEMPDFYPAGDEQVLVYEATGRIVPEGGIPIHVGCVVVNVETTLNMYRAMEGKSVTHSYVTVSGVVPHAVTLCVPVGMAMKEVVALAGINDLTGYAVIDGGPMMGRVLTNHKAAVMKKTKGYIILPENHPLILQKTASDAAALRQGKVGCEQCRMCTDLCPRHLLGHNLHPHKLVRAVKYNMSTLEELTQATLCSQCGVCTLFACPANLKPHQINFFLKQQLGAHKLRYTPTTDTYTADRARAYRRVPVKRLMRRIGIYAYDQAAPFENAAIVPEVVCISLRQHVGAPAIPTVTVGDTVTTGELIGTIPEKALGATVHASINGIVEAVTDEEITIRRGG